MSITTLAISVVALAVSTRLAINSYRTQKNANYVPALMSLLSVMRTTQFHRHYAYLITELSTLNEPSNGVSGLPENAQEALYNVAFLLQEFALLARWGILDEQQIAGLLHRRYMDTWNAIKPFVEKERELVGPPFLLRVLEEFADRIAAISPELLASDLYGYKYLKRL